MSSLGASSICGKRKGGKPMWGAVAKTEGREVVFRANKDRAADTPGRGLPWPESLRAAADAAKAAGLSREKFGYAVARQSRGKIHYTSIARWLKGARGPTIPSTRRGLCMALNFTEAELPPPNGPRAAGADRECEGYPNEADEAMQEWWRDAALRIWGKYGPVADVSRYILYAARAEKEKSIFSECLRHATVETDNLQ